MSSSRRILAGLVLVALVLTGCGGQQATSPPAGAPGTTPATAPTPPPAAAPAAPAPAVAKDLGPVTLLIHPTLYAATGGEKGVIAQFTEQTGIKVNVVTAPSEQLLEKAMIEFNAKSGRYDVLSFTSPWINTETARFLEPLDGYIQKAGPAYAPDDLIASLVDANRVAGKLYAVPFRVGTAMLYYRKDLFAQHGIRAPENWEDFLKAAQTLTLKQGGKVDVYGVFQRGKPGFEITQDFIRFLFAHGADVLNADKTKAVLDSPQGIKALNTFVTLYRQGYNPPDMLALSRDDQITALQQGRAAMSVTFSPYWSNIVGKDSKVAEQMGWALLPAEAGVPRGRTMNTLWTLVVSGDSKHKDAAWQLSEALSNKANQLEMALKYGNGPIRSSVYQNAEFAGKFPLAKDWLTATAQSKLEPSHPRYPEMVDMMSEEITAALQGQKTPEQAMKSATKRIDDLLKK